MEDKNLFVAEEEDVPMPGSPEVSESQESPLLQPAPEDDPIVRSIPLVHGVLPNRNAQSLHVLQFAGRPKTQLFAGQSLRALVKPASKVVQLKTPMNTLKFYNEGRAEELGGRVENLALQGVLTDTNGGLYAGKIVGQDADQRIVLIPLDSTAQLRPLFKYIDDLDSARHQAVRQEHAAGEPPKSAVQVLQTAAKQGNSVNESQIGAGVGLCLRHVKRFNEEEWLGLSWFGGQDSATGRLVLQMADAKTDPVAAATVLDEFL